MKPKYDISFDSFNNILTIDGVNITLEALKFLIEPYPNSTYSFSRDSNVITIHQHHVTSHDTLSVV